MLSKLQREFLANIVVLLSWGLVRGYQFTFGDAFDADGDGGHMRNSNHSRRLALDVNLFVGGVYITDGSHPAYLELGKVWKTLHPLARWGGDFGDANHFSFEYNGVK